MLIQNRCTAIVNYHRFTMVTSFVTIPNNVRDPAWTVTQCKNSATNSSAQENLFPDNRHLLEPYDASWSLANCTHPNQPLELLSFIYYTTCLSIMISSSYIRNNSTRKTIEMQFFCGKERVTLAIDFDEKHLCVDMAVDGVFLDYFDCGLLRRGVSYALDVHEGQRMDIVQICKKGRYYNSVLSLARLNRSIGIEACKCGNVSSFRTFWGRIRQCSRGLHREGVIRADRFLEVLIELVIVVILIIVFVNFLGC